MSETWLHRPGCIAAGYLRSPVPPFAHLEHSNKIPLQDIAKSLKQYLAAQDKHYQSVNYYQ